MLEVVLLSRNRPELASTAIESLLRQVDQDFKLWISDNSSTKETPRLLRDRFPSLAIIERGGALSQFEHMKVVFNETEGDYVVLMHDDDAVSPFFTRFLSTCIEVHPDCSILFNRVVSSATPCSLESLDLFKGGATYPNFFYPAFTRVISDYLLGCFNGEYYSISMTMFKRNDVIRYLDCLNDNCIYSDALLMLSISAYNRFIFNNTPSGLYYLGETSISHTRSFLDIRRFASSLSQADFASNFLNDIAFFKLRYRLNSLSLYRRRPSAYKHLAVSFFCFCLQPKYLYLVLKTGLRRLSRFTRNMLISRR